MNGSERVEAAQIAMAITGVAEEAFDTVRVVQDEALRAHRETIARRGHVRGQDIGELAPRLRALLLRQAGPVTGLGVILAPGILLDEPLRLEWWQSEPGGGQPVALQVDLDPRSLGFYDYAAAEWFDVPRRTGRRHVVGPYVDVHGTGRYIFTFAMPLVLDGTFLGVVGADVPASWLESRLLNELGRSPSLVVVNGAGRVVLSSSARRPTGTLWTADAASDSADEHHLPRLPWKLRVDLLQNH